DPVNFTMTVEAGCILAQLQEAAAEADQLFPLSLGAEGSCQIGGNLSTNAGGIAVLRYGNTRELTLGLEVVLPDGRIWDGLRALRKDNTGYDLKQLFIGGEGTLGIITAATLKLFPRPREVETAFLAFDRIEDVMAVFARARAASGDQLTAYELIPRIGLEIGMRHVHGVVDPVAFGHVGDGNIPFNLSQPVGADTKAYLARWADVNRIVHDIVAGLGGSISAEHGIGRLKVDELEHYKAPLELELMRRVKRALD